MRNATNSRRERYSSSGQSRGKSRRSEFNAGLFSYTKFSALEDNPRGALHCAFDEDQPRKEEIEMKAFIKTSPDAEVAMAQSVDIPKFTFSHILAPTDFSPNSDRAVDYAVQLARRLGAKLTLLHIVPEPSALDYPIEGISAEEIEGQKKEAEKRLADQLARAKLQHQEVDSGPANCSSPPR